MARFKVGDKVQIKEGLKAGANTKGKNFICQDMCDDYAGRIGTIVKDWGPGHGYSLDIDEGRWVWFGRCLKKAFTWKRFKKGKIRVELDSIVAAEDFRKQAGKRGYQWFDGTPLTEWRPDIPVYFVHCLRPVYGGAGKRVFYGIEGLGEYARIPSFKWE